MQENSCLFYIFYIFSLQVSFLVDFSWNVFFLSSCFPLPKLSSFDLCHTHALHTFWGATVCHSHRVFVVVFRLLLIIFCLPVELLLLLSCSFVHFLRNLFFVCEKLDLSLPCVLWVCASSSNNSKGSSSSKSLICWSLGIKNVFPIALSTQQCAYMRVCVRKIMQIAFWWMKQLSDLTTAFYLSTVSPKLQISAIYLMAFNNCVQFKRSENKNKTH